MTQGTLLEEVKPVVRVTAVYRREEPNRRRLNHNLVSRATPNQLKASGRKKRVRATRLTELAKEAAALNITPDVLRIRKAREWGATVRPELLAVFPDLRRTSYGYYR